MNSSRKDFSVTCRIDLRKLIHATHHAQAGLSSPLEKTPIPKLLPIRVKEIGQRSLLDVLGDESRRLREAGAAPAVLLPLLLANIGFTPETPFALAGADLSQEAEVTMTRPTYHNPQHITEVLIAAYCLGQREHLPDPYLGELLLAAVSHDLGHTGAMNREPYELESRSADIAVPILSRYIHDENSLHRITEMIHATDFKYGVPEARERYLNTRDLPADDEIRLRANQCLLLTEADVLFSCFDEDYNTRLSSLLSVEWQRPQANLSIEERLGFLTSVRFISTAATELGLEQRRLALCEQLRNRT
jgi:hypothetical protein